MHNIKQVITCCCCCLLPYDCSGAAGLVLFQSGRNQSKPTAWAASCWWTNVSRPSVNSNDIINNNRVPGLLCCCVGGVVSGWGTNWRLLRLLRRARWPIVFQTADHAIPSFYLILRVFNVLITHGVCLLNLCIGGSCWNHCSRVVCTRNQYYSPQDINVTNDTTF